MTVTFYAQPYDIDATGFYFSDAETYKETIGKITNRYGDPVEEFELQFIDGTVLNSKLARAIEPNQCNILPMMDAMETWNEEQKLKVIIAVGECGLSFDFESGDPDDLDIDLYTDMSLKDLAYIFVDEGMFGDIPEHLSNYIDYGAITRDLAHDYVETSIAGDSYVYRMA
ncbi:MAG: antirestriction protein ArdA [Cohaesibacter sp.]|nr:antirestriction protein ArdA [Cohaesibacter sp.]